MDILRLQCFLAVLQEGSFSAAADSLYLSQSAVSKQVQALERAWGQPLFDRTHRQICPTAKALALQPLAERLCRDYQALQAAALQSEPLRIASIPTMAQYGIAELLSAFRRRYPAVQLVLSEQEGQALPRLLQAGAYDLAFLRLDAQTPKELHFLPLYTDRLVAVVAAGHPLAGRDQIGLAELAAEPFLLLDQGTRLYGLCLQACRHSGFLPTVSYTGTRPENILELVAGGMGVTLLMERTARYHSRPGLAVLPLADPVASAVGLAWAKGGAGSAAARSFRAFAASYCKRQGAG